jgi:hypothetical protein
VGFSPLTFVVICFYFDRLGDLQKIASKKYIFYGLARDQRAGNKGSKKDNGNESKARNAKNGKKKPGIQK